jgi:hypothetical protein
LHDLPVSVPAPVAEFLFQQITKIHELSNEALLAASTYGKVSDCFGGVMLHPVNPTIVDSHVLGNSTAQQALILSLAHRTIMALTNLRSQ